MLTVRTLRVFLEKLKKEGVPDTTPVGHCGYYNEFYPHTFLPELRKNGKEYVGVIFDIPFIGEEPD